jgi:hypothetical protein
MVPFAEVLGKHGGIWVETEVNDESSCDGVADRWLAVSQAGDEASEDTSVSVSALKVSERRLDGIGEDVANTRFRDESSVHHPPALQ